MRIPKAASNVREGIEETLTYYSFLASHWRRIRTKNPFERIMREIRVVGAFPNSRSALMLAAVRLRHIVGTQWGHKRYMKMELLKDLYALKTNVA